MPTTARRALRRDLRLAAQHTAPVRRQFRRERDRLARDPGRDPVRDREWVAVIAALWAAADDVFTDTVQELNPSVDAGTPPVFAGFVAAAAAGIAANTRRRIATVRELATVRKLPNLSRQLRKLYQVDFVKKRAVRIALDQALRQTATYENAAANRVQAATGAEVLKVWHNQGDSRVRGTHLSVAAVLLDKPFIVGGAELRYPRDPAGPGSETYGCRCWSEYQV